ncbi:MAG TPA: Lrp/AsnC family transcriptional regulator [Jiangellaceae bacterium]|nr:Lrp/AsnC family transcriptional regulator [Jiangellaceae bacterium]
MVPSGHLLDELDVSLLSALREHPRVGAAELARVISVTRATVQARLRRLEQAGVVTGYGPDVDLTAAGFPVQAFVTLEISQGALDDVTATLVEIPNVLEAYATTGSGDVLCRIAAGSHEELQSTLLKLTRSSTLVRSTSVMVLSEIVRARVLPLLAGAARAGGNRAPAYRRSDQP